MFNILAVKNRINTFNLPYDGGFPAIGFNTGICRLDVKTKTKNNNITEDIATLVTKYIDTDCLNSIEIESWVSERNPVVKGFVEGVAIGKDCKEKVYVVDKAVKAIYHAINRHVILPATCLFKDLSYPTQCLTANWPQM